MVVGHGVDGLDGRRGQVVCVHSDVDVSSLDHDQEVDQIKKIMKMKMKEEQEVDQEMITQIYMNQKVKIYLII